MSCTPWHCTNHCLCNQYCVAHAPVCSSNAYSFSNPSLGSSYLVRTYHMNQLRTAINQERSRRNLSYYSFGPAVTTGYTVLGSHYYALRNALNSMWNIISDTYSTTENISHSKVSTLRTRINQLRVDCVCNSNCDKHSSCSCHGNCGNNYSDENLKDEIKYL